VATSLNNIAGVYRALGQHKEALEFHQQSLAIDKKFYGESHPDVATSLNNIAGVYRALGQHKEALEFHQQSLTIFKQFYGEEHPATKWVQKNIDNLSQLINSKNEKNNEQKFKNSLDSLKERGLSIIESSVKNTDNKNIVTKDDNEKHESLKVNIN
jgi:tetratricopeptide (TPR) repeat protein